MSWLDDAAKMSLRAAGISRKKPANLIRVRRAKHRKGSPTEPHNWIIEDRSQPERFIRTFTYSTYEVAVQNADQLARNGRIDPRGLVAVQRVNPWHDHHSLY
jgi:hypothetical protein